MADIKLIKELRSQTGLGIHDISKALDEAQGNKETALKLLKQWGLSTVAKKADRSTNQGLIDAYVHSGRIGAIVEVNCETDFVARNDDFKKFVREIAMQIAAMNPVATEDLLKQPYFRDQEKTIEELLNETISKIGENIKISRFERLELNQ